jgi:hypothetical protein
MGRKSFVGQHGWTHGYLVTTVGHDTQVLRRTSTSKSTRTSASSR